MRVHGSSRLPHPFLGTADEIELVKAILGAYVTVSNFGRTMWPFRLLIAKGARSNPPKTSTNKRPRPWCGHEFNCTD
jgi:hypothetical protein